MRCATSRHVPGLGLSRLVMVSTLGLTARHDQRMGPRREQDGRLRRFIFVDDAFRPCLEIRPSRWHRLAIGPCRGTTARRVLSAGGTVAIREARPSIDAGLRTPFPADHDGVVFSPLTARMSTIWRIFRRDRVDRACCKQIAGKVNTAVTRRRRPGLLPVPSSGCERARTFNRLDVEPRQRLVAVTGAYARVA